MPNIFEGMKESLTKKYYGVPGYVYAGGGAILLALFVFKKKKPTSEKEFTGAPPVGGAGRSGGGGVQTITLPGTPISFAVPTLPTGFPTTPSYTVPSFQQAVAAPQRTTSQIYYASGGGGGGSSAPNYAAPAPSVHYVSAPTSESSSDEQTFWNQPPEIQQMFNDVWWSGVAPQMWQMQHEAELQPGFEGWNIPVGEPYQLTPYSPTGNPEYYDQPTDQPSNQVAIGLGGGYAQNIVESTGETVGEPYQIEPTNWYEPEPAYQEPATQSTAESVQSYEAPQETTNDYQPSQESQSEPSNYEEPAFNDQYAVDLGGGYAQNYDAFGSP